MTFGAVIANAGAGDAANITVRFLVDGVAVGADQAIATLAAGTNATLTASWSAKVHNGVHTLEVRVDPANTIPELNETNNGASRTFTVLKSKVQ